MGVTYIKFTVVKSKITTLLVLLMLVMYATAQRAGTFSDYRFNKIEAAHGLSQSSVLSLFQDPGGYIWMGTKDGLNRFDGYSFEVFKNNPLNKATLSNNEITLIKADLNGDLLIGTRGGGLNRYNYKKNTFVRPCNGMPQTTIVYCLFFDSDSNLWVGTSAGLLLGIPADSSDYGYYFTNIVSKSIFNDASGAIIPHTKTHVAVAAMVPLSNNQILIGSDNGVFVYNKFHSVFRKMDLGFINVSKITSIIKRAENEFFIGSSEGLIYAVWDGNTLNKKIEYRVNQPFSYKLNYNWVNNMVVDKNNIIWGGTRGGGLFTIDTNNIIDLFNNVNNFSFGITDNIINSLIIDKTDVLWIGTESQGCYQLDLNRKKFYHFENVPGYTQNISQNLITAITGDGKKTLYTGTAFNGINKVNFTTGNNYTIEQVDLRGVPNEMNNEIISLLLDSKNNLWVGSQRNYIIKIQPDKKIISIPTEAFVFSIYEDIEGNVWYGTWGNGFGKVNPENNTVFSFSNTQNNFQTLSSDNVLSLLRDSFGNFWVGTKGGGLNVSPVNLLNQGLSSFANYTFVEGQANCLSHNDIYCIFQDSKQNIWIGTGNGLNMLELPNNENPSEAILKGKAKFITYTEGDGLPNNVIYGILEDNDGNIWISTINGLAKIRTDVFEITRYSVNDGLQDNEFHSNAYYKDKNGQLFFGGIKGVSFFNPTAIKPNPHKANAVITGLKISGQRVGPGVEVFNRVVLQNDISTLNQITLGPKHKEFTIEFSGMHYSNTNNVVYAYRLLGFNNEWRYTRNNERWANYTNLLEGDYVFQVKATNNDGEWSDNITELNINIQPTLWRNPWFFMFYLLIILTLLFFFRQYSLIGVKEKNRLKIEAYERKKTVELTEAKMRFFTTISHEIRTPLTLIYSPIERLLDGIDLSDETRKALTLVKKNVDRLLNLTNQLLELRKIDIGFVEMQFEKIRFIPYIKDILEYFEQQFKGRQINVVTVFDFENNKDDVWVDKEMLTTAIFNLLSNAYKYSVKNGEIKIHAYHTSELNEKKSRKNKKNKQPLSYLNIEIIDNGKGIPAKDLPNVFKRFYQAQNHDREQAGSGIGLSIVKEYIELHHGNISVTSLSGKGSTFLIQLPLGNYHIEPSQFKSVSSVTKNTLPGLNIADTTEKPNSNINNNDCVDDTKPLVLIAEDDIDMLDFLSKCLSDKYSIITAQNGKIAWAKIQEHMPSLVISDIMMPEIDGRELCKLVKSDIETCHVPIILLSAQAANDDIINGYSQGADRYISKPFAPDLLVAQVDQLINTRKQLIDLYSKKILLKPREITITSMDEKFITKLMDIIEENISDTNFDIATIVDKMNMSHSSVLKKIKALTGVSLVEFVRRHRLNKAAMILQQEKLPITEVAYMTGFSDPKYFSKCFSKQFGKTPTDYANENNS